LFRFENVNQFLDKPTLAAISKPKGMKRNLLILFPVLIGTIGMTLVRKNFNGTFAGPVRKTDISAAIGCAPIANENIYAGNSGKFITILPGWGNHSYRITTTSDSAQIYFNQGLSMYYSYHMTEAIASFKEATKFDSTCAMLYWGQALAMGPDYNYGYTYKIKAGVPAVMEQMNRNKHQASTKEKDLIEAMNKRYDLNDLADQQRKALNEDYAEAMKPLVSKYPDDIDVKALYTDAVMLVHPWTFWNNDGSPKPWTPQLVGHCQNILKKNPHHPAGLHYYIHITEASRNPAVALASADSLIKLFPGVAHMVHMSSHEYERLGYYEKGVHANEEADRSLGRYASLAKSLDLSVHASHYFAVDAYCALSGAMNKKAIPKALALRNLVKPTYEGTYSQYLYMFPLLAMIRMGKWEDILHDTSSINEDWKYAGLLNDFAKGMAYAKTGNYTQAEKYLEQLREKQKDKQLRVRFAPHRSSPYECSIVAENILIANTAFHQKKYKEAFTSIKKAIVAEDSLIYAEPKVWMLPSRQYLGAFLLMLHRPKEAEKTYREDLVWNPGNGWSLLGLHQSLKAQQKPQELKKIRTLYMNSFSQAGVLPTASAY
jgi:tetratricopeptide (TPR) repeat protein